jgi:hypothetical protein
MTCMSSSAVILGLVPRIHVFSPLCFQDVGGRDKPGDDGGEARRVSMKGRGR